MMTAKFARLTSHILEIGAPVILTGASALLVTALQNALASGDQFIYIRVEDPVSPYPLPA